MTMDCAVRLASGELMFCSGPWVSFINPPNKTALRPPMDAADIFGPTFPAFPEALLIGRGNRAHKIYVFSRGQYWRYDAPTPSSRNIPLDPGHPKKISDVWFEMGTFHRAREHGIDGAVTLPGGRIFFFAGAECIEHIWGQKTTTGPNPIAQIFPQMSLNADYYFMGGRPNMLDYLYVVRGDTASIYDPNRGRPMTATTIKISDTWAGLEPSIPRTRLAPLRQRARARLPANWANVDVAETLGQTALTLATPMRVNQGSYPTCGQAAVIFCLAQYFPDLYVDYFLGALGRGGLPGTGTIKAHSRTFKARDKTYDEPWLPNMGITSNDWVLTALLRDDASQFMRVKNDGADVRNGITTPNEMRFQLNHLLPKSGTARVNRAFHPRMREAALKWAHEARHRGGVAIHLVCAEIVPGGPVSSFANHWVTHLGGLNISHGNRSLRSNDDRYRMRVQSWGAAHNISWSGDQLKSIKKGYYGSVRWVP
ncbi:hypothetical protein ROLI_008850 [Roseobacter fucihabitans]|uniref:Peptidase C39-like domain-containing protein n=1 Tax=Roseobacter fucihabitans TaxID=1537242 RepID=A0ABZ2BQS8_9RHOB|nr:hemopexin repeat-containing protein [Roseobacter litoralis]MBC6967007.1 Hemopexin [Roseobacter litoralis]